MEAMIPVAEMTEEQAKAEYFRILQEFDAIQAETRRSKENISRLKAETDILHEETKRNLARIQEELTFLRLSRYTS